MKAHQFRDMARTRGQAPRGLHDRARGPCATRGTFARSFHERSGSARQRRHPPPFVGNVRQGPATPASVTGMRRSYGWEATADLDEDLRELQRGLDLWSLTQIQLANADDETQPSLSAAGFRLVILACSDSASIHSMVRCRHHMEF